ncbi:MAG TPA: dTDP-4-dehydrorhamnose 3,5-epimerase [Actinomycetota bacterium]|nr:dTDP-4-dehydrorhamnose 3,5-epimerase [Actinomycetota bacterium]HRY09867.1 dTDP-4-dehydrorhamnose 3,5-epimerase [Candidatus Nanopelagicales bacterium]
MRVVESDLSGVLAFHPQVHRDDRGFFTRTWDRAVAEAVGLPEFVQDSQSRSEHAVIRGLHLRSGPGEAKLVRCARGRIWDVVVDLRPGSPTFLQWRSFELDDVDHVSLYIPAGMGHGWQALSELADVCYRIDAEHDPRCDVTVAFDDPGLAVPWPLPASVTSERDRHGISLHELLGLLG